MALACLPLVSSYSLCCARPALGVSVRCEGREFLGFEYASSLTYPSISSANAADGCERGWRERRALTRDQRVSSHGNGIGGRRVYATCGMKEFRTPVTPYDGATHRTHTKSVQLLSSGCREVSKSWGGGTARTLRFCKRSRTFGAAGNCGVAVCRSQSVARVVAVEAVDPPQELSVEELIIAVNAEEIEREPELAEGGGGTGKEGGDSGGGGGGDGEGDEGKEPRMSTSQTLTLIYAFLVGGGGLIGFAKSGSYKSLLTGGVAALALFVVYARLPLQPAVASSFGLGISAVLLGIMYPRFKKSGKFMPAGLVALVSLIMTGGYLHGIVRTTH